LAGSYARAAGLLTRGQLLDLVLEIEDRLRALIRGVFIRTSPNWVHLIPRTTREALEMEARSRGAASESDLLRFANLKQLVDTMAAKWALFQPIMEDKRWLQANLDDLRKARNDLAHGVQPSVDEKVRIALLASEIGKRIPVQGEPSPDGVTAGSVRHLNHRRILWADDVPEGNTWARRILTGFGAEVVPVLTNEEAVHEATQSHFHVAVSDIDRGGAESGAALGVRLKAAGIDIPIIFFIVNVDPSLPLPVGGVLVTNDMVAMFTRLFAILRPDALGSG
jgi:CheY-like chemotaxis protein